MHPCKILATEFPKLRDTSMTRVDIEFVIGMSRGSAVQRAIASGEKPKGDREQVGKRTPGRFREPKKCGRHARYLSSDIVDTYRACGWMGCERGKERW